MSGHGVEGLLERIAKASPDAGGGVAVAITGAMAAALVGMVAGIAARHAPRVPALGAAVAEAETLRARLTELIETDVKVYAKVIEARRRTDAGREAAVREALVGATEVPVEVAVAAARILEQAVALVPLARPSTRADVGVAGLLAAAALEGAALTARSNLEALADRAFVEDVRDRVDALLRQGATLRARLLRALQAGPA